MDDLKQAHFLYGLIEMAQKAWLPIQMAVGPFYTGKVQNDKLANQM